MRLAHSIERVCERLEKGTLCIGDFMRHAEPRFPAYFLIKNLRPSRQEEKAALARLKKRVLYGYKVDDPTRKELIRILTLITLGVYAGELDHTFFENI